MSKDFLQTLRYKGFTARIKRLSDSMFYDSKRYFSNYHLDLEPNWHMIFLLLKVEKELTVTEIAKKVKFSHPAIIKITKKMKEKGYLESLQDSSDNRKTILRLSKKGLFHLPAFEEQWEKVDSIIREVVDEEFLSKLAEIEDNLSKLTISERFLIKYNDMY